MSKSSGKSTRQIRGERKKAQHRKQQTRTIIVLGVLGIAVLGFVLYPQTEAPEVPTARLEDQPSLGSPDAKVVLVEFGDFACSACRTWHQSGIIEELLTSYGDDLRVEWRDYPIITSESPKAAQAGQCAHDQGLFWEFLDRVYSEPGSSYTNVSVNDLRQYAADINLDVDAFNNCLDSDQHRNTVIFDLEAASDLGLLGTPSFLVNGQAIFGANPQYLVQAIDEALAGD